MIPENLDKHVILYESCQLTRGYSRSLLIDIQRNHIEFLDNEMYAILAERGRKDCIGNILAAYDDEEQETIIEYLDYFLGMEYVFLCTEDELGFFPVMSKQWDHHSIISNCIIDIKEEYFDLARYKELFHEIDALGCENMQVRMFDDVSLDTISSILEALNRTGIYRIELLLKQDYSLDTEGYKTLLRQYPLINELIVHSSGCSDVIKLDTDQIFFYTREKINDNSHCGIVSKSYFNINIHHYTESFKHNTCLNRKLGIDVDGNIKNCPSLKTIYGNITKDRISDVVKLEAFQKIWSLDKSQVITCNICEFRNVCTDCRAFHDADYNINKPAKCKYDPITNIWDE